VIALAMAAAGFGTGFVLDSIIAFLAREPYERGDFDDDAGSPPDTEPPNGRAALEFADERGAAALPAALGAASAYRRTAVVAITAALFAGLGTQYDDPLQLAVVAAYAAALIVCAATDALSYRVPNVITYPAILAALAIGMTMPDVDRVDVALGGALAGGTFFAMAIATRGGMGMGDVKLALFGGLALGLSLAVSALLITAMLGGIAAVLLLVTRVRERRDPIPYAPFIAAGMIYTMLVLGTPFQSV
jgi:leader peptidase (prepilin peptidase)/N-methyltransferase